MKYVLYVAIPLILLVTAVVAYFGKTNSTLPFQSQKTGSPQNVIVEAQKLEGKNYSFDELKKHFQNLAREKGAAYAFSVLKVAKLPPNTDLHLLGHAVGDILYKQQGLEGIRICTEDFRNACSHTIVVGLFLDKGDAAIPDIAKACEKAPGGTGAYTMCFHGLGHGILSAVSFNVEEAVKLCQKVGESVGKGGEYPQCAGGIVMEIVGGGDHDKMTWGQQRKKYLTKENPLSLCSSSLIPQEGKIFCYIYITPFLWEAKGANLGNPTASDFQNTFPICNEIPINEPQNRDACYGGFGKEFIGLVASRDIRRVDQMDKNQLKTVYEWCQLAGSQEGSGACIVHALNALYWGGENNRHGALRLCSVISDNDYFQKTCYMNLIDAVNAYIKDQNYRKDFCSELPNEYKNPCQGKLL